MQTIQNKNIAPGIKLYRNHKIFIEPATPNRMGRVYAEGNKRVFYLIQDTLGQRISSLGLPELDKCEDSARIEDFNRYIQAGRLLWSQ